MVTTETTDQLTGQGPRQNHHRVMIIIWGQEYEEEEPEDFLPLLMDIAVVAGWMVMPSCGLAGKGRWSAEIRITAVNGIGSRGAAAAEMGINSRIP